MAVTTSGTAAGVVSASSSAWPCAGRQPAAVPAVAMPAAAASLRNWRRSSTMEPPDRRTRPARCGAWSRANPVDSSLLRRVEQRRILTRAIMGCPAIVNADSQRLCFFAWRAVRASPSRVSDPDGGPDAPRGLAAADRHNGPVLRDGEVPNERHPVLSGRQGSQLPVLRPHRPDDVARILDPRLRAPRPDGRTSKAVRSAPEPIDPGVSRIRG